MDLPRTLKISFDMRSYDQSEAFRRAVERYESEEDSTETFDVKLVKVQYHRSPEKDKCCFHWEFEVIES